MSVTENVVRISLQAINELFVDPDLDPLTNAHLGVSGVQQVFGQLQQRPIKGDLQIEIRLPASEVRKVRITTIQAAWRRYCEFQVQEKLAASALARRDGWHKLPTGLGVTVVCAISYWLLTQLPTLYPRIGVTVVSGILGGLFLVTAWIMLWTPLDSLAYGWRYPKEEAQVYEKMSKAILVIKTETRKK